MARAALLVLTLLVFTLNVAPIGSAKLLDAYDLVGTDKAGDGVMPLVTGYTYPACGTGFGCGKFDISSLEAGKGADVVQFKLNVAASYSGSSSLLYGVHFKVGGKAYATCWNINSAGPTGSSQDITEDATVGCLRFSEPRVGGTTKATGVDVGVDKKNQNYVAWQVKAADIGLTADTPAITDIFTEIWSRSVSTCCPPSTAPQSQYVWNIADRGPDTGTWTWSLAPAAPALSLMLTTENANATAGPAGTGAFNVTVGLVGNGTANVTFNATGLPSGYTASFSPSNASLSAAANSTSITVSVSVPANATNGTHAFQVTAMAPGNISASVNLTLTVDAALPPPAGSSGTSSGNATTQASGNETGGAKEAANKKSIPAPNILIGAASLLTAAVASRRRRIV